MAAHVVMYAKRTCPYCHRAERLLRERGVNDLELIFIGGQHVGGSDDLAALDRAGKLAPMLA